MSPAAVEAARTWWLAESPEEQHRLVQIAARPTRSMPPREKAAYVRSVLGLRAYAATRFGQRGYLVPGLSHYPAHHFAPWDGERIACPCEARTARCWHAWLVALEIEAYGSPWTFTQSGRLAA